MENIELKVGASVPAWTYHECEHCGHIYPISRCSVKIVTEKDLMCQECWDAQVIIDKEDEIAEMKKYIDELKTALGLTNIELLSLINLHNQKLKDGICSSDLDDPDYVDYQTVYDNDVLLSKHNKGE